MRKYSLLSNTLQQISRFAPHIHTNQHVEYILFHPVFQICQSYHHVQNKIIVLCSSQVKHCDFIEMILRSVGVMTEGQLFKCMWIPKVSEALFLILLREVGKKMGLNK